MDTLTSKFRTMLQAEIKSQISDHVTVLVSGAKTMDRPADQVGLEAVRLISAIGALRSVLDMIEDVERKLIEG